MNYMPRVLGVSAQDGKTALFVKNYMVIYLMIYILLVKLSV
jgi:hypothetical protein